MSDLEWEAPPLRTGGPAGKYWDIAAELQLRPGQWAVVLTNTKITPSNLRKANAFQPLGSYEFAGRGRNSETRVFAKIYARFVGEPEDE